MTKKFCDKCKKESRVFLGSFSCPSYMPMVGFEICEDCLRKLGNDMGMIREVEIYIKFYK